MVPLGMNTAAAEERRHVPFQRLQRAAFAVSVRALLDTTDLGEREELAFHVARAVPGELLATSLQRRSDAEWSG